MKSLKTIMIRHGIKVNAENDELAPLSCEGKEEAKDRAKILKGLEIRPQKFLTSPHKHAEDTAKILNNILSNGDDADIINVESLKPGSKKDPKPPPTIEGLMEDATMQRFELSAFKDTLALVGHEPILSMLITLMTGERIRPLDRLDVVCIEAQDFNELRQGKGEIAWRYPVKDYQEERLSPKLTSKTTAATFLAGFTFAALLQVVTSKQILKAEKIFNWEQVNFLRCEFLLLIASLFLTAALGLFIASVYIYDRLGMPEGFWWLDARPSWEKLPKFVQDNKDRHGMVYSYMIYTWNRFFTWGVISAMLGFLIIVFAVSSIWTSLLFAILIAISMCYYLAKRPKLGVD